MAIYDFVVSSRLTLALIFCGAAIAALIALSFWNLSASLLALCAALSGAAITHFLGRRQEELSKKRLDDGSVANAASMKVVESRLGVDAASSSALLEATMNSMREGVLVIDAGMHVVVMNRAARDIFSPVEGALERRRLSELTRNLSIYNAFRAALEQGERAEVKVEAHAGERRVFDLRVAPLRFGLRGQERGALGVFFDITQLERLERVRQEFLSNVSHELRTPLTAILAFVETLEEGAIEDSENSRRFLSVIRKNATRMHNLIDDILELSAIEAGTVPFEPQRVRLHSIIEDITTALASRASTRQVTLQNKVAPDTFVYADPRRLEQMLTNLIDNAIKFNREGGRVTISHEACARGDRISIADTGDGISGEHIERIFERFYRVDRARSREAGGTGLGLAIVKHLARTHGGEATVHSIPGEGATFTIELPNERTEGSKQ